MEQLRILALDLGRSTGWAVLDSGELRTASYHASNEGDGVYVDWAEWLRQRIEAEQPEAIAYEQVQFNRGRSYIPGMTALLLVTAYQFGVTCFGVPVPTLKAFARRSAPSGTWTGSKADMQRALVEREGTAALDMTDDEVDAAWVALWAHETLIEQPAEVSDPATLPARPTSPPDPQPSPPPGPSTHRPRTRVVAYPGSGRPAP